MSKYIKYKDIIKKMKPFENHDVVMVAGNEFVSFFSQDGMVNIVRLYECEDKDGNVKVMEEQQ
jgi:hypothetical protein